MSTGDTWETLSTCSFSGCRLELAIMDRVKEGVGSPGFRTPLVVGRPNATRQYRKLAQRLLSWEATILQAEGQ